MTQLKFARKNFRILEIQKTYQNEIFLKRDKHTKNT